MREVEKWERFVVNWRGLHKAEKAKTEGGMDQVNLMELNEVEKGGIVEVKLKEVTVERVKMEVPERFNIKSKLQIGDAEQDEEVFGSSEVMYKEEVALKKVHGIVEKKSGEVVDVKSNTLKKRERSSGGGVAGARGGAVEVVGAGEGVTCVERSSLA